MISELCADLPKFGPSTSNMAHRAFKLKNKEFTVALSWPLKWLRLQDAKRRLAHLQRIQNHAKTDEHAARVLKEFAAHARQTISR